MFNVGNKKTISTIDWGRFDNRFLIPERETNFSPEQVQNNIKQQKRRKQIQKTRKYYLGNFKQSRTVFICSYGAGGKGDSP